MKRIVRAYRIVVAVVAVLAVAACSSVKHVPQGQLLLNNVTIDIDGDKELDATEMSYFLRQHPNHKVLGFAKLSLGAYSLSGRDSTKWYNKWLRRAGQAPVIYSAAQTEASVSQLRTALMNKGYMDATVSVDSVADHGRRRIDLTYHIVTGKPHTIASYSYNVADTSMARIVDAARVASEISVGDNFDRTVLDRERTRLTRLMQDNGYYRFTRDYINFSADTVAGSKELTLRVNVHRPVFNVRGNAAAADSVIEDGRHHVYYIRTVTFYVDADRSAATHRDTVRYGSTDVVYGPDPYLKASLLDEMCHLIPGEAYSTRAVERTYEALGRLSIVKYVNIETIPAGAIGDAGLLDIAITLSRNKKQSVSAELEGTNSEGDLGFGIGLGYTHRNLARGSETFNAKFRASYESLNGNFDGLVNKRYTEYAAETGISFPKFKCPFLSKHFKQQILASTEFALSFNWQERPEYTRIIAGASWKWKWQQHRPTGLRRQTYDLIDINYVRLPRSTIDFLDEIAPSNPLLRYSYEDHFIMRMGYTYTFTNRRAPSAGTMAAAWQPRLWSVRFNVETAGNLLYAISKAVGQKKSDGVYKVLGIQYSQYVKGEIDYNFTRRFDRRNSVAFRAGFGIAYPYGNSSMVPFEKRFYAGGANGVRGWGVRTLGPGSYDSQNSVTDFINQCGDIRLDLSAEYRAKLFWVLEGAVFIDAGNIWTIHNYPNQPGGMFKFNRFYKEIAAAYGIGLRLDFTYFLLRLDLGFKAYNPAQNQEKWPLIHPKWSRDANFHFAVGYPF